MKSSTFRLLVYVLACMPLATSLCMAQRGGGRASARQSVNRPPSADRGAGGGGDFNRGGSADRNANFGGAADRNANVSGTANRNANVNGNRNANLNQNNVNVNRNVNVNGGYSGGDYHGGGYYGGGCCYHPVAAAATVAAGAAVTAAAIGSVVNSVPASCIPVDVGGATYQQCGSTWYQPQFSSGQTTYVVVNPPN